MGPIPAAIQPMRDSPSVPLVTSELEHQGALGHRMVIRGPDGPDRGARTSPARLDTAIAQPTTRRLKTLTLAATSREPPGSTRARYRPRQPVGAPGCEAPLPEVRHCRRCFIATGGHDDVPAVVDAGEPTNGHEPHHSLAADPDVPRPGRSVDAGHAVCDAALLMAHPDPGKPCGIAGRLGRWWALRPRSVRARGDTEQPAPRAPVGVGRLALDEPVHGYRVPSVCFVKETLALSRIVLGSSTTFTRRRSVRSSSVVMPCRDRFRSGLFWTPAGSQSGRSRRCTTTGG